MGSALAAPVGVLGLNCEVDGFGFGEVVAGPQTVKQDETEVSPECFLDHFTVALAEPSGADLDRSQHVLVDGERRARLALLPARGQADARAEVGDLPAGGVVLIL